MKTECLVKKTKANNKRIEPNTKKVNSMIMYNNIMHTSDLAIALDIGTTKVCAIAGIRNEYGKIDILGIGSVKSEGVSKGVVSNIERTSKAIEQAIEAAESSSGKKFTTVHVGIAGQHIKSIHHHGLLVRNNGLAEITKLDVEKLINDMHKLVLPAGDRILHVIPQEFSVDDEGDIIDPIGMGGVRLEANFHIITGQISASQNIIRCVEKVGLKVADMTLEPIASANAVLSDEEKEAGVILVDIGGGTTDITIFKDGIIRHTSVIPFGGTTITKDIKEGCIVMQDQAEKLKVRFGSAMSEEVYDNRIITIPGIRGGESKEVSEKNLARIIQARVEEIFDYVLWEIKRSGYEDKLFAGLVLTGGGSLLKNINLLVEYHTGLGVRIGVPVDHLAHGYSSQLASPVYSTALGLLITAIDQQEAKSAEIKAQEAKAVLDLKEKEVENTVSGDDEEPREQKSKWMSKFFTYTKEFFEATPDSEF